MEQIIFDGSYVLKTATFLKSYFRYSIFLRVAHLFHHSKYNYPSFVVGDFVTERVAVVHSLKYDVYVLTCDFAVIHYLLEQVFQH